MFRNHLITALTVLTRGMFVKTVLTPTLFDALVDWKPVQAFQDTGVM